MAAQSKEVYAKMAPSIDRNRKIRRGGRDARDVYLWVLRRVAERGVTNWRIPAEDVQDADYLADELMCTADEARTGLERAILVRLLAIDGDECVVCGGEDEWARKAMTGAERTAKWKKSRSGDDATVSAPSPGDARVTVTSSAVTAENAGDVGEERRGEERESRHRDRQPDKPASAPPPRKSRLPDQWQPPLELEAVARDEGVSLAREMGKLKDWAAAEGTKKADWTATARNWLKRAGEDRRKAKRPPEVDRPSSGALFAGTATGPPSVARDDTPRINWLHTSDDPPRTKCPDS
jgi:hypothetical protein